VNEVQRWPQIFIPLATIFDVCCEVFGLTRAEFMSWKHTRTPKLARGAAVIIARHCSPASYPEIGRALGDRESASITNLEKRSIERQQDDPRYADAIQRSLTRALELMTERAGGGPSVAKAKLRSIQ